MCVGVTRVKSHNRVGQFSADTLLSCKVITNWKHSLKTLWERLQGSSECFNLNRKGRRHLWSHSYTRYSPTSIDHTINITAQSPSPVFPVNGVEAGGGKKTQKRMSQINEWPELRMLKKATDNKGTWASFLPTLTLLQGSALEISSTIQAYCHMLMVSNFACLSVWVKRRKT